MGSHDKKKRRHRSRERSDHHKSKRRRDSSDSSSSASSRRGSDSDGSDRGRRERGHKRRSRSPRDRHRQRSRSPRDRHDHSFHSHGKRRHKSQSPDTRSLNPAQIEILKAERKKEKQLLKALETPEEKRARRLAKKESKERKRKEKMGWDEEYMGYTNTDNPFGDEHLLDTFMWQKKLDKMGIKGASKDEIEKLQKAKMVENKIELEKVKKRRLEREREREERDNEHEMMQRAKEAEYYREWEQQEDTFHLQQAKLRSKIRIEDGRAKPIDLLGRYISAEEDDFSVEMHEPYTYLNGLTIRDLEDLLEDIKVYMELEQSKNTDYWRDITTIVRDEIDTLKKMDSTSREFIGDRRSGINTSVSDDVNTVFKGKSMQHLEMLEAQIKRKLQGGEGVDVGYWESLLQKLKAHMARTRLREKHQEHLRKKLFKLKQEQGIESEPLFPIIHEDKESEDDEDEPLPGTSGAATGSPESKEAANQSDESGDEENKEVVLTEEDLLAHSYAEYDAGNYSPRLVRIVDLNPDAIVYDPEDDMKRLEFARMQLQQTGRAKKDTDAELVKRAREGMTGDEAQFSVEVPLADQTLLWSDKYRPRKPRFFNRVHTGFEWNKYNQTHYDIDNPPPKIVQGYKFNIFYPDLIDKAKTPEYVLKPLPDNSDFGMLRFKAGPPYEDIAFKIVNREWECSYKRGFRCQFHNNIFQLWFHFKRYRYRR